jgi:hypothetical protein
VIAAVKSDSYSTVQPGPQGRDKGQAVMERARYGQQTETQPVPLKSSAMIPVTDRHMGTQGDYSSRAKSPAGLSLPQLKDLRADHTHTTQEQDTGLIYPGRKWGKRSTTWGPVPV